MSAIRWQPHLGDDRFTWECPNCGATNTGQLAPEPVSGWDSPRWRLTGERDRPTLEPSLGCWHCFPAGHYWCRDGELVAA